MRRTATPAMPAVPHYYGALKPAGAINAEGFRTHDAMQTWDDGGRAIHLANEIAEAIKAYGAEQARDAVAEYNSDAYLDMAVIEGVASVVLDTSNDSAQFRVYWPLEELLSKVAGEAIEAGDESMIQAIYTACERATLMLQATPAPAAPPERPVIRSKVVSRQPVVPAVRRGR